MPAEIGGAEPGTAILGIAFIADLDADARLARF